MKRWRLFQTERRTFGMYVELETNPHDVWVGVYWRFHRFRATISGSDRRWGSFSNRPWALDVYVCVVPCLPLLVTVSRVVRP